MSKKQSALFGGKTIDELRRIAFADGQDWTLSEMGAVWVGGLSEDEPGYSKGLTKDSHKIFEVDPYDLEWVDEDDAEYEARRLMELAVTARNALPDLLRHIEKLESRK